MKIRPISVFGVPRDWSPSFAWADDVSFIIIFYIYKKSKQFGLKTKLRCARLALQFHAYGFFILWTKHILAT